MRRSQLSCIKQTTLKCYHKLHDITNSNQTHNFQSSSMITEEPTVMKTPKTCIQLSNKQLSTRHHDDQFLQNWHN